jgi:thioredoxin 1
MALAITDATFDSSIKIRQTSSSRFFGQHGGPCRMVGPVIDEVSSEYEGESSSW